jgi:hypothetical protein
MDAVGMKAFVNRVRKVHEMRHRLVRHDNVGRGDGFLLIQAPDVQFMNGEDAGNLDP